MLPPVSTFRKAAALLALCVALAGCATPPPGVPSNAASRYDWYNSHSTYTWSRRLQSGCAAWVATDRWANVQLVANARCERRRDEGYLDGRGVSYFSSSNYLIFRGYWPWSTSEFSRQIEFDDRGMISTSAPARTPSRPNSSPNCARLRNKRSALRPPTRSGAC